MILIAVAIIFSLGYAFLLHHILRTWQDHAIWHIPSDFNPKTRVSVLIAARNEENGIQQCLQSIISGDYPEDLYEVIVVNDHSTDDTEKKVKSLESPKIKLINLQGSLGKKKALESGMALAQGELIACIDADCIAPSSWLSAFVSYYESNPVECMAGPIRYDSNTSLIQRFQYLDSMNNMAVTAHGIDHQSFYMANGANFFFSKSAYKSVGGYQNKLNLASGDDMFMIQQIADKFPNKIAFNKSVEGIVTTQAEENFGALIRQRARWATKSKYYQNNGIFRIQAFVAAFVAYILLSLFLAIVWKPWVVISFVICVIAKLTLDYYYLSRLAHFFGRKELLHPFISVSIAYLAYILYAAWKAIFPSSYVWKERRTQ